MKLSKLFIVLIALTVSLGPIWAKATRSHEKEIPSHHFEAHWYVTPPKELKEFQVSLEKMQKQAKDEKFIKRAFQKIKKVTPAIDKTAQVAASWLHKHKNRYGFFLAFDDTRTGRDLKDFYVNANDVHTPMHEYIVTQGPLEHTVGDFWRAVLHRKSKLIVTLVMAQEEGKEKCADFWIEKRFPLEVDGWKITLEKITTVAIAAASPDHQITKRTFVATNTRENKTHTIEQLHYENWPDLGIPNMDLFCDLLDEVDMTLKHSKTPITVHCSAGIGRSGTFVAAHSLRSEINHALASTKAKNITVNIPEAIFLLRCQRTVLVGNKEQLQFIYKALSKTL